MSASQVISFYLAMQWFFGSLAEMVPGSRMEPEGCFTHWHFAALPIIVTVIQRPGVGNGARFYRTVILEEINAGITFARHGRRA